MKFGNCRGLEKILNDPIFQYSMVVVDDGEDLIFWGTEKTKWVDLLCFVRPRQHTICVCKFWIDACRGKFFRLGHASTEVNDKRLNLATNQNIYSLTINKLRDLDGIFESTKGSHHLLYVIVERKPIRRWVFMGAFFTMRERGFSFLFNIPFKNRHAGNNGNNLMKKSLLNSLNVKAELR